MKHTAAPRCGKRKRVREKECSARRRRGQSGIHAGAVLLFVVVLSWVLGGGISSFAHAAFDVDYNLDAEGPRGPYHDSPVDPSLNFLDFYLPEEGGSGLPVMIYVHGGSWKSGDKGNTAWNDELFTGEGFVFVSVNYRLSPDPMDPGAENRVIFPDHPHDVAEAIRYLYDIKVM